MYQTQDPIGVFDSGVGGISVLRQLRRLMPDEQFLYFGDCGNAPYGIQSAARVEKLCLDACETLIREGVKALVVACNTATAVAIDALRKTYPDRIIVGIEPALKLAVDRFPGGNVGVMATPLTLHEDKYFRLSIPLASRAGIHEIPVTGLVELVEKGKGNSPEAEALLCPLLESWRGRLDALVLGCTHYPFAAEAISRIVGPETVLLSGGEGTARQTRRLLRERGLLREDGCGKVCFRFSGNAVEAEAVARTLLGAHIPEEL